MAASLRQALAPLMFPVMAMSSSVADTLAGSLPWLAPFHSSRPRVRAGEAPRGSRFFAQRSAGTGTIGLVAGSTAKREVPNAPSPALSVSSPAALQGFFSVRRPKPDWQLRLSAARLNSVANSADPAGNDESAHPLLMKIVSRAGSAAMTRED
jgi:hypothetical protein